MLWNKKRDTISINPSIFDSEIGQSITKRTILAAAHKIFDPIGVTCPVSLKPKMILRNLWEEKIDWDVNLEGKTKDDFLQWSKEIKLIKNIEIPRAISIGNVTLHTFGDASGVAYAAVVFARVEWGDSVQVTLLNAKSRVTPKGATIPRLELMAATIGVRLAQTVIQSLSREILDSTYWSDSSTALAWIHRDIEWGVFVRNRVKEIRSLSEPKNWKFVPGEMNPADLPSRGCTPSQLVDSQWWLGPLWLYQPESEWPKGRQEIDEKEIIGERNKTIVTQMTNICNYNVLDPKEKQKVEVSRHIFTFPYKSVCAVDTSVLFFSSLILLSADRA
ncbi:uncharacterized protein LOC127280293 [Leptopilina boulardi]|uniref:uncharacterized protein LOC127280293 n=1 Tax=Leptopilina boulardi TaxID=63433 RepID=UPI0021F683C0|nr:uncharacterized protein LOC127280293 [Leptopilina boulardi]